ncbi:alpha/beta hydrolase [Mesorhizobium sp. ISC15]|uniref:alpha/beta hydrolase n=1 Tax=Mesorhizobium sp. ISC15 TaxID=3076429 RepID=UPI00301D4FB7
MQHKLTKTTVVYREIGGHQIRADLYRPAGNRKVPILVFIHGGALITGHREFDVDHSAAAETRDFHAPEPRLLALAEERGYALVSFDYRLAPETELPEIISDVEAAFTWLAGDAVHKFNLNVDRLVVIGNSAGGYLTLVTRYRVNPMPRALVALHGYGNLHADWYAQPNPYSSYLHPKVTQDEVAAQSDGRIISNDRDRTGQGHLIYLYYRQNGLWPQAVSGFDLSSISEKLAPYEPAKNVTRDFPPTLMIHGTQDTDVPYKGISADGVRIRAPWGSAPSAADR